MFKKIKEFFTGTKSEEVQTPAPYKVELAPVVETMVSPQVDAPVPVGIEAVMAAPVTVAKPAVAPKAAKPKATTPAAKKPHAPKAK